MLASIRFSGTNRMPCGIRSGTGFYRKALTRPFSRRELAVVLDRFALDVVQVEGGIQDTAITAETLGFIERGVGFPHQRGLVDRRAVSGGDARADGDVSAAGGRVRNAQRPNRQPNALGDLQGGAFRG